MRPIIEIVFKFIMYAVFGLSLETVFSVIGINLALGFRLEGRVPKKYLEGFVSLYMIPVHGLGLFAFAYIFSKTASLFILWRYMIWCVLITAVEAFAGFVYDKLLGFYPWDYYADSKYKIFKRGYTLWTLAPLWGIAGLLIEVYIKIINYVSPHVINIILGQN